MGMFADSAGDWDGLGLSKGWTRVEDELGLRLNPGEVQEKQNTADYHW